MPVGFLSAHNCYPSSSYCNVNGIKLKLKLNKKWTYSGLGTKLRGTHKISGHALKMEAKIKPGPHIYRAVLGDIHNKPHLQANGNLKKTQTEALKKSDVSKCFPQRKVSSCKKKIQKENLCVPVKTENADESMEAEVAEMKVEKLSKAFSAQVLNINDIDKEDWKNPQLVSEYVVDIYNYLWKLEEEFPVQTNYLDGQKITGRMRAILIDWLVQVHLRFTLLQETLYLTIAIIDRYLQANKTITKDRLQLVGVTAMFIAAKYEEVYIPEIGDFAFTTDKAFSKKDIRVMEVDMLSTLNFYVSFPLSLHFLRRNSKAGQVDAAHHTLAKYIIELTLTEYSFCHYKPSLIAASALYLAVQILGGNIPWNIDMVYYSNYSEKEILPVVYKMSAMIIRSSTSKYQAVRTKYKSPRLMRISEIQELSPLSRLLKNNAEKSSGKC